MSQLIDENPNLLWASKCCRHKAVVVAVYAEKPPGEGGRRRDLHHHHHHHHHHHYHHFHQNKNGSRIDGKKARGYNRRADLLDYSRHLRAPAQSNASPSSHPSSHNKQLATVEVLAIDGRKKKKHYSPSNGCFKKWGFGVTKFLKTTTDNKKRNHKKSLVKSLQKKGSFFSKLFAALQKRRR